MNFKDSYNGEKGKLDLDYWVIDYNLNKAKKQFQQVKPMLKAFEYWFGAYPFYEDRTNLLTLHIWEWNIKVTLPTGNGYQNGYLGRDLSGTGVGLKLGLHHYSRKRTRMVCQQYYSQRSGRYVDS